MCNNKAGVNCELTSTEEKQPDLEYKLLQSDTLANDVRTNSARARWALRPRRRHARRAQLLFAQQKPSRI